MFFSIRSRVLLLVLATLLPGMLGVTWLISTTYSAEREANERTLRDTARAVSQVIDSELMRRATIARVLSQSHWLDAPAPATPEALEQFEQLALRALVGLDGWIELRNADQVLVDTRGEAFSGRSLPHHTLAQQPRVEPLWMPPAVKTGSDARPAAGPQPTADTAPDAAPNTTPASVPHAAILQPVQRDDRTVYELVITVLPGELQRIVDAQTLTPGWVGAVLDSQGSLVARYPGGAAYVGRSATADLRRHLQERSEALFQSVSLDGQKTTVYFSRAPMGWTYVLGMPKEMFAGRLPDAVLHVALGALLLLALAVVGALWVARRIVRPVQGLKRAVLEMQSGQPVQVLATGLAECDEVTGALATAAQTIRNGRAELERQVADAVEKTRLAEQQAAQGQRVAAVGRLTAGVAHDFNNLLGVVSNSAHLIQRHPAAAELQSPLAATQRAVQMGSQLTQHLMRFAGRQAVKRQQVRLGAALPEMQELLGSVLGSRVTVSVQVAPGTAAVFVDASELEMAIIHLALNARDAMPSGGELRLRARNATADDLADARANNPNLAPSRYVLITVGDDGVGIEPELAAHAFEPFFTSKGLGQGSGLGLSQVHGFCTEAGGSARLDSTLGLGTTVMLLLPAARGIPSPALSSAPARAGDTAQTDHLIAGARVLLVEDNQTLGEITAALLVVHGAQVERADDAAQALQRVDAGQTFDVVLTDVMMPGAMDGLALARRLRVLRPLLPVVLITAFGQAVAGEAAEFTVLSKPCPQDELLLALSKAISSKAGRSG